MKKITIIPTTFTDKELKMLIKDTIPEMYRIRYEDGELSDIYNKTWAKEHLRRYLAR